MIPAVEYIFEGAAVEIPTKPEILYALSGEILDFAKKNESAQKMKNALAYVNKLPREFKNKIYQDFLSLTHMLKVLQNNASFDDWFARSGRSWERYGL